MKWCHGQLDARESETWRNLPLTETVAFHLRFPKASGGGPPFSCTIGSRSHSPHLTPRQKPLARLTYPKAARPVAYAVELGVSRAYLVYQFSIDQPVRATVGDIRVSTLGIDLQSPLEQIWGMLIPLTC